MTDRKDMHDVYRHRNLQRMGRELALPAEPDPQRVERWKLSRPPANQTEPGRTVGFVQRHKPMVLLTSGAAAAPMMQVSGNHNRPHALSPPNRISVR